MAAVGFIPIAAIFLFVGAIEQAALRWRAEEALREGAWGGLGLRVTPVALPEKWHEVPSSHYFGCISSLGISEIILSRNLGAARLGTLTIDCN
jgi:hypothetical protein